MKRSRKLGMMLAVLAVICVMTAAVSMVQEKKENIAISGETILSIPVDTVKSFCWTEGEKSLSFHRGESGWVSDEDGKFPASTAKVEELLRPFEAFGAGFTIEDVEDPGLYGLDEPTATLTLETEEQVWEIVLGDYSKMDRQRYVTIGDGKVYLAAHDPYGDFGDITLRNLVLDDQIPDMDGRVEKIRFTGGDSYEITRRETSSSYREDDLWYTEREGESVPLNSFLVEDYLSHLNSGILYNYTDYYAEGEDLAAYGLSDPELTVEVTYREEEEEKTFTLHLGLDPDQVREQESMTEAERETAEPIAAYAQVEGSRIVYRLDSTTYESLSHCTFNDLRHKEVIPAEVGEIQTITFTLDGEECTLTSEQKEEEQVWLHQEEELADSGLTDALTNLRITEFREAEPTGALELSFTAVLAREGKPEVRVELYRQDGSTCLAVVDGKAVGLAARKDVVELAESVNRILLDEKSETQ